MSQCPLSIRDLIVPLHVVYVDYDVLLRESKLSESIVFVIGIEEMASVRRNVHSLDSSFSVTAASGSSHVYPRLGCLHVTKKKKKKE